MNIILVLDGPAIEHAAFLHIGLSQMCEMEFRYFLAVPEDAQPLTIDRNRFDKRTVFFSIPTPDLKVDGKPYRIINKIRAMKYAPVQKAVLMDSDTFFNKAPDSEFMFRGYCAAAPEHNPPPIPNAERIWERLYQHFEVTATASRIMTGSKKYGVPYFNAGLIASENTPKFGNIWESTLLEMNSIDWLPKKFPYLDQLSLPFSMARASDNRRISHDFILPNSYNFNLFHWNRAIETDRTHVMYHHHNRISLLQALFPTKIGTFAQKFTEAETILPSMARAEYMKYIRKKQYKL